MSDIYIQNINLNDNNSVISLEQNIEKDEYKLIELIKFGKEDITNIPENIMISILENSYMSIAKLINYIHCNDDKQENNNICFDKKNGFKYDGKQWQKCDINELVKEVIELHLKYLKFIFNKCKHLKNIKNLNIDFTYEDILEKSEKQIKFILYDIKLMTEKKLTEFNRMNIKAIQNNNVLY